MNKSTAQPARFVARCSESSCISIYTAVARLVHEARPFGADAPFRSGETVLRAVRLAGGLARYDFFTSSESA